MCFCFLVGGSKWAGGGLVTENSISLRLAVPGRRAAGRHTLTACRQAASSTWDKNKKGRFCYKSVFRYEYERSERSQW
eukprot:1870511-Prymnesium_polylepis.1